MGVDFFGGPNYHRRGIRVLRVDVDQCQRIVLLVSETRSQIIFLQVDVEICVFHVELLTNLLPQLIDRAAARQADCFYSVCICDFDNDVGENRG